MGVGVGVEVGVGVGVAAGAGPQSGWIWEPDAESVRLVRLEPSASITHISDDLSKAILFASGENTGCRSL